MKSKLQTLFNKFRQLFTYYDEAGNKIDGRITQYPCSTHYLNKKHFCFQCNGMLEKKIRRVVVNSASEEARNYDFSVGDMYCRGNVEFVTFYFECPECGTVYEIAELKRLGNRKKKEKLLKRS